MVAPYVVWIQLEFLLGKLLSVKVPINKDNFGFVGRFLARWKFDFCGCEVAEMLDFSGF